MPANRPLYLSQPELTVVVPTYNERQNLAPLIGLLQTALAGIDWEVVFVDDNSPDGTAQEVSRLGLEHPNVRLLHRIGRRGLAGACIEGILSSFAPIVAVMDGDLQHDETKLRDMFSAFQADPALDLVICSRNVENGSPGDGLSAFRKWGSDQATRLAKLALGITASDPMSGFFMVKRQSFNTVVVNLQPQGFKILADMLSASRGAWKIQEVAYVFRERQFGISKMDSAVTLEFLGLMASHMTGGLLSIRFILFGLVGISGILVQLAMVKLAMVLGIHNFIEAQTFAVICAMTSNFYLNNLLTYRDRSLKGMAFLKGLMSFYVVCSVGAVANVGVASGLFAIFPYWALSSIAGAIVGALWNFVASSVFTWRTR
jgi:dolichol-phosphate mannosyltransferase